jgi:DNA-binding response OmpR family regulator
VPLGGTVLLVNGHDCREMYGDYFRAHGLIVADAATPEIAFRHLDSIDPDVVVTDVVFPESAFRGREFIEALRARIDRATSIIVVSGFVRNEDREEARAVGADLYLLKPALPSAVLFEVRRALILRRSGRRLAWNWPERAASAARVDRDRRQSRAS